MIEFVIFVAVALVGYYAANRWLFKRTVQVTPNISVGGGSPVEPEDPNQNEK
jgi:hypothetical protein